MAVVLGGFYFTIFRPLSEHSGSATELLHNTHTRTLTLHIWSSVCGRFPASRILCAPWKPRTRRLRTHPLLTSGNADSISQNSFQNHLSAQGRVRHLKEKLRWVCNLVVFKLINVTIYITLEDNSRYIRLRVRTSMTWLWFWFWLGCGFCWWRACCFCLNITWLW